MYDIKQSGRTGKHRCFSKVSRQNYKHVIPLIKASMTSCSDLEVQGQIAMLGS